jgi:SAM-dependent methyltransferase
VNPPDDARLTSEGFWDQWWKRVTLPDVPDRCNSFDRTFLDFYDRHLSLEGRHSLVEVGCAPGRWLVHFRRRFGCRVAGCEYSPKGLEVLRRNLAAAGVEADIFEGDFMTRDMGGRTFDVVLSKGFLEHFADPLAVARRHAELLAPGGLLLLDVPNLRGLNRWFQRKDLLDAHNLDVMTPAFFRSLADQVGCRLRFLGYVGGFEPGILDTRTRPFLLRAAKAILGRLRRLPGMGKVDSRLWSGYLLGVFEKPGGSQSLYRE